MKKLLFVAIALVAAASIAFAISAFTGSSGSPTPGPAEVRDDDSGGPGTLSTDNCIVDVDILYCIPVPLDKCLTTFAVKHWDTTGDCCAHHSGTLHFRIGGSGPYAAMTEDGSGYDDDTGCYYHNWHSGTYELVNDTTVLYDVKDSADETNCKNSGSFYIHCQ